MVSDHDVELRQKRQVALINRKIEGKRIPLHRKRHQPFLWAEQFHYRKEGTCLVLGNLPQYCGHSRAARWLWQHKLILHETTRAIYPIPICDSIEGIKIRF